MFNAADKYQTLAPRVLAVIVDAIIFLPLILLDGFAAAINLKIIPYSLWLFLFSLAHPIYIIVLHGLYGQTLGKMLMRVKVVDVRENPITFHHAALRELPILAYSFSSIFFTLANLSKVQDSFSNLAESGIQFLFIVWLIGDIAVFFVSPQRRSLHDFIAGTVVIKTNV